MKIFTVHKSAESDYKNLLDVFAEMEIQSFTELSLCQKKEIIAAWLEEDEHEDDALNLLLDFKRTGSLSELMYDGINAQDAGEILVQMMLDGDHTKSIDIDIDEAFTERLMSLDNYESDDDAHRLVDNIDRVKCARMGF